MVICSVCGTSTKFFNSSKQGTLCNPCFNTWYNSELIKRLQIFKQLNQRLSNENEISQISQALLNEMEID